MLIKDNIKVGINSEAPQSEMESVVSPLIQLDLIRTARPFSETSKHLSYDQYGWPLLSAKQTAKLTLLQNHDTSDLLPGYYHLFFKGEGSVQFKGYGTLDKIISPTHYRLYIDFDHPLKRMDLILKGSISQLRLIPEAGTCQRAIHHLALSSQDCPKGEFISYPELVEKNPDYQIINPVYLSFLKDFETIRWMNYMEASPRASICKTEDCLRAPLTDRDLPTIHDAQWGGSHLTSGENKMGKGIPLPILVSLSNLSKTNPWIVIPHQSDESYVKAVAIYLNAHLDSALIPRIEYSNETWNGHYLAFHYLKDLADQNNSSISNPYWRVLDQYAIQSSRLFRQWGQYYSRPYIRTVSGYQNSVETSQFLLKHPALQGQIDQLAIGGYFYLCGTPQQHVDCKDRPTLLSLRNEEGILKELKDKDNPYGLDHLMNQWNRHHELAKLYSVKLAMYEGGQHLTVPWGKLPREDGLALAELLIQVNRSSAMKSIYFDWVRQLMSFEQLGDFMIYTSPQRYHRFGAFGIKEGLRNDRSTSPKYDGLLDALEQ